MAAAAAATPAPAGGNNNNNNPDDLGMLYHAVNAGATGDEVRAILAGGPRTRAAHKAWLTGVLGFTSTGGETALGAAHRLRAGPVVGALLEHGADVTALHPDANPLVVCIAYGQVESLRVLLRSRRYDANEQVAPMWTLNSSVGEPDEFVRPAHACIMPPRLAATAPPPQLECLNVLVREFGADVNGRGLHGVTPLHWICLAAEGHRRRAFDALMALGADVNARDEEGGTPITAVIKSHDPELLQACLARGASPNAISTRGCTPLIQAVVSAGESSDPRAYEVLSAVLRVSSVETRRSTSSCFDGASALDLLLERFDGDEEFPTPAAERDAAYEIALARAPVRPENAAAALPYFARAAEQRARQLALHEAQPTTWRAHEAFVGLAFDALDARLAEAAAEQKEARVRELEEELRRRGIATEDTEDEESG